jgi:hypothetical protein
MGSGLRTPTSRHTMNRNRSARTTYCISGAYLVIKAGLHISGKKYQQTRVVVNIRINREY